MSKIKRFEPLTGTISDIGNISNVNFPTVEVEKSEVYLEICKDICDQFYTEKNRELSQKEKRLLKKYLKISKYINKEDALMCLANYCLTDLVNKGE